MRLERAPHWLRAALTLGAVGAVTGLLYALDRVAPVLSLGALYLLAVLPAALLWGLLYAVVASLASMAAFNVLFLPPLYSFTLADSENWVALAIYMATAVVVSELAARARRRAAEAEQRSREQAALAEVATSLLSARDAQEELDGLAPRLGQLLRVRGVRIEVGTASPGAEDQAVELRAGRERVGRLVLDAPDPASPEPRSGFLDALASLLAVAVERDRLADEALEAEALRRSDLAKTALLRAVSHDLQSPLTAIITASETARSRTLRLDPADQQALLETISSEAYRLEHFVRDLLDLSRLEAGAASPAPELWAADELVGQALAGVGPGAERVLVSIPPDPPLVRVDAGQVRRALANLLDNALKFSPAGSPVRVDVTRAGGEVAIRVVDEGPGIPAADAARVFEPFFRTGGQSGVRGTGLGLAIARGFTLANGGRIWLEPAPGGGSSFALGFAAVEAPIALAP